MLALVYHAAILVVSRGHLEIGSVSFELLVVSLVLAEFLSTVLFVVLVSHRHIATLAKVGVIFIELFVAAFKNVNFRIEKLRVDIHVQASVNLPQG